MNLEYFMDKCSEWEINDIIDLIPYCDRSQWEGARLNAYVTAQVNSRKRLNQQDICRFKWEDEDDTLFQENEDAQRITDEDINRLAKISKQWEKE
jgi:hypothetical protein